MKYCILIIGGGAAGLAAAISAVWHNPKVSVCVLERKDRVGKKILATGNGCCNITNENMDILYYFGKEIESIREILSSFSPVETKAFFMRLGVLCKTEPDGKVYPYSYQASSVLDALRNEAGRLGIEIRENFDVKQIFQQKDMFALMDGSHEKLLGHKVIIAAGGCASPQLGSDGSGFALLRRMGHTIITPKPALVQLKTETTLVKALQGTKVEAMLSIWHNEKCLFKEEGEVLFTPYGLSGPPVFQGSRLTCYYENLIARLDLMPDYTQEQVEWLLKERQMTLGHLTCEHFFTGLIHKKLGQAIGKLAGIEKLSLSVACIPQKILQRIAYLIKNLQIPISGAKGWDSAQVTAGGAALDEFNMQTLESKKIKGLYGAGEILDVFGCCGGYNLQWAWASGFLAGKSASGGKKYVKN